MKQEISLANAPYFDPNEDRKEIHFYRKYMHYTLLGGYQTFALFILDMSLIIAVIYSFMWVRTLECNIRPRDRRMDFNAVLQNSHRIILYMAKH